MSQRDFFISFNSADLAYAQAINDALLAGGYSTFFHPKDLPPAGIIPAWMDESLMNSGQTIALYSPDYTKNAAVYSRAELYATFWQDPGNDRRKLIPVVLRETEFSPLIAPFKRISVVGMTWEEAGAHLVKELKQAAESGPRDIWRKGLPLPKIFNAAYRPNPNFTGRFDALESLHRSLRAGSNAAITAVAGLGGIGKTTLAAEFCHRFGGRFGGVWWIRAGQEPVMLADLQALGLRFTGVASGQNVEADARATLDHLASVGEPWLLVYDNAPNPDAVRKWLPTGAVRCIITSRFTEFGDLAAVTRLDQWSDDVTAGYLIDRTERKDGPGALRLAKALGGLPLAAEQAAVYLRPRPDISFDGYAANLAGHIKRKKDAGIAGNYPDSVYAAFVTSLEALGANEAGGTGLDILRLCSFLSPDGVHLDLLTVEWGSECLPSSLADALADAERRSDALAALHSASLLKRTEGLAGTVLIFHRLLLEVVRNWIGEEARNLWGTAAVQLVSGAFPYDADDNPSQWPLCAILMPHVAPLDASAPRAGDAGNALGRLLNQAGIYLYSRGDREGALALAEKSVQLARDVPAEPLQITTRLDNLGGRYESLEIKEQLLGPADPNLAITLNGLAILYWMRKHFAEAEPLFLRAAEILKTAHGEMSAEYSTALSNIGALYSDWSDMPGESERRGAEEEYKTKEFLICLRVRGLRHPETATSYANLATMRARRGNWPGAVSDAERSLAIVLSLDLAQHPETKLRANDLIYTWEQVGDVAKATRLRNGDISDILPVIAQIENEHRAWVAEDPVNRHFGPSSPFVP
jgi:tetratricopeptide (TPR) repeat protein